MCCIIIFNVCATNTMLLNESILGENVLGKFYISVSKLYKYCMHNVHHQLFFFIHLFFFLNVA